MSFHNDVDVGKGIRTILLNMLYLKRVGFHFTKEVSIFSHNVREQAADAFDMQNDTLCNNITAIRIK